MLAFLLAIATNNPALYERHYVWLFWVNVALASTLVLVIVVAGVRMLWRVSRGSFGSRLLLKLAAIFALVGILPGVLIYTVSYQFVSRSIESWFDVKVEGALDAGLNLGRGTLDTHRQRPRDQDPAGRRAPRRERVVGRAALARAPARAALGARDRGRRQRRPDAARDRQRDLGADARARPRRSMLRQARTQRVVSQAEGLDEDASAAAAPTRARVRAVAVIPSSNFALGEQERFLVVTQSLAPGLAANALAVTSAYREYQQRALARAGLRKMYIGTLTLALVLAVFGALLLAIALGNQLAQPLLLLAEGVRQVARGDFSSKAVFASRDELGGLTRSFAEMTEQLSDARELVQQERRPGRGRARQPADDPRQPDRRRDRVRPRRARSTPSTRARRASCALPLSAYRGRRLDEVAGLGGFAQAGVAALRAARRQPRGGRARPLAGLVRAADRRRRRRAASATRSPCSCAARRCRRARA